MHITYSSYIFYILLFNVLIRWMVSMNKYSGYNKPKIYGDFEAQRHWMEIAINLPVNEWYKNTTNNDLLYWGLDYPPLTAYHSWLMGHVSTKINNTWVEIHKSRGIESQHLKLFMRISVILVDLIIYFLFFIFYWKIYFWKSTINQLVYVFITLSYPGIIMVDHGHFQYNCISLGLFLASIVFINLEYLCLAACAFSLALNYKQMELYHSLPIFFYMIGKCVGKSSMFDRLVLLLKIATVTLITFGICWAPFLTDYDTFTSVLKRLFPFDRGLYEDKVANFWCSVSPFIKFRRLFDQKVLVIMSITLTLIGSLPSCIKCLVSPQRDNLTMALVNTSLSFYLFSFQVHEKSILLVTTPMLMLLPTYPFSSVNFLLISYVSMYPMFVKDDLILPFYALLVMYFWVFCHEMLIRPLADFEPATKFSFYKKLLYRLSAISAITLCIAFHWISLPNGKYPDLMTLLICQFSCVHFIFYLVYFNYQLLWYSKQLSPSLTKNIFTQLIVKELRKKAL